MKRKVYPPVDEMGQRALSMNFGPYCMSDCPSFERDYGNTPFCNATTPRTETSWTGKCVCPKRWMGAARKET